ncbi:MAG: ATP-binding protein [Draconibacterium sp.]|nr:ATP-binding protein [Draconibacterium sp.]
MELFVNELFDEFKISSKYFNNVFLCISEAVVNSIKHGNKSELCKKVSIVANLVENILNIKILDEGEGFNLMNVKDPIDCLNIKNETGRGIHIIKTLSESLEFNKKGNGIQFKIDCK